MLPYFDVDHVGAKRTNILAMAQDLLDTPKMDLYKAMPLRGNK